MPQLIVFGLVAALGFYCWGKLREELARLEEADRLRRKAAEAEKRARAQTLTRDPETGVYRPDGE